MSRPSNTILPAVGSSSRVSSRPVVVLPQPDSPTSDSVSPLRDREVEPVDGLHRADLALQQPAADREVLLQPGDGQQHLASPDSVGAPARSQLQQSQISPFTASA